MSCHLFVRSLPARVRAALLCCLFVLSSLLPVMPTAFAADVTEVIGSETKGIATDSSIHVTFSDLNNIGHSPVATAPSKSLSDVSTTLSATRVQELLSSLPPLPQDTKPAFRFPQSVASATERFRNGFTPLQTTIPVNETPRAQPARELTVSRISHSGPVDEIRQLAITFSQPMVAIGQGGKPDVASLISLTPQPPGVWQWAGDRTLIFTPTQQRMPQATRYEVKISENASSIEGAKLSKSTSWTIETPKAKLVDYAPDVVRDGALSTKPIFVACFNQSVDATAVLGQTRLMMGGHAYALKVLDASRLDLKVLPARLRLHNSPAAHWFAFTPVVDLPRDSSGEMIFAADLPSAEGPLKGSEVCRYPVKTYGPLRLLNEKAHHRLKETHILSTRYPDRAWAIDFSNPIDITVFKESMVESVPPVKEFNCAAYGNQVMLAGDFEPGVDYKIKIDAGIKDKFGQSLGLTGVASLRGSTSTSFGRRDAFLSFAPGAPKPYKLYRPGLGNLKINIWRVEPEYWDTFYSHYGKTLPAKIGVFCGSKIIASDGFSVDKEIDLGAFIEPKYGQYIVEERWLHHGQSVDDKQAAPHYCWVQVTDLSLDTFGIGRYDAFVSSLIDGKPLQDVALKICRTDVAATTDKNGLAVLEIPVTIKVMPKHGWTVVAKRGADSCIVTVPSVPSFERSKYKWYAVSDRHLYKPGETIKVKGWLRQRGIKSGTSPNLLLPDVKTVDYKWITGASTVLKGRTALDEHGGFAFDVVVPVEVRLGGFALDIFPTGGDEDSENQDHTLVEFRVDEFRRPEFEIKLNGLSKTPVLIGDDCNVELRTKYLSGGGLANTPVRWQVSASPGFFWSLDWSDFSFRNTSESLHRDFGANWQQFSEAFTSQTNTSGVSTIALKTEQAVTAGPIDLSCWATVTDLNRQEWTERFKTTVLPSRICVGIRNFRSQCTAGKPIEIEVVATDTNGKVQDGVDVAVDIKEFDDQSAEIGKSVQAVTVNAKSASLRYQTNEKARRILIVAQAKDREGHVYRVQKETDLAEPGHHLSSDSLSKLLTRSSRNGYELQMRADKMSYKPGDVAKVTINSPIYPVSGILLSEHDNDRTAMPLTLKSAATEIEVPIVSDYCPAVDLKAHVSFNRDAFCEGHITLPIPPDHHKISLTVTPSGDIARPAQQVSVDIALKDGESKPVTGGQVALMVVDESVLALADYRFTDPLDVMFDDRRYPIDSYHSKTQDPTIPISAHWVTFHEAPVEKNVPIGEGQMPAGSLRKNFSALAFFKSALITDANGNASATFTLPDSITRYRVVAIAAADSDKFGKGESSIAATLPLSIRPSAPRFLHAGDNFELPVVLQNHTDKPLNAEVAIRASNATLTEPGKRVLVPANDRVEVRFKASAGGQSQAYFQCVAMTSEQSDSAEFVVPIELATVARTIATADSITGANASHGVSIPDDVYSTYGGLTITTSSSASDTLDASIRYMRDYSYNCTEQIASRLIAKLAVIDSLLVHHSLSQSDAEHFRGSIVGDLRLLQDRQMRSGAFCLWQRDEIATWPFVTCQAAQALIIAKRKGFVVDPAVLSLALDRLKNIDSEIDRDMSREARLTIQAYALFVRALSGDFDIASARELALLDGRKPKGDKPCERISPALSSEVAAWLLPILSRDKEHIELAEQLRRVIYSRITETAATASVNPPVYGDDNYQVFGSQSRADALVLSALVDDQSGGQADSGLVPKLAKGLLNSRRNGIWGGTQENNVALYALSKYFEKYEKEVPDCLTQAWLDNALVMQEQFKGRTTESKSVTVPMSYLQSNGAKTLEIAKRGAGRIYYNLALEYLPKTPPVDSDERGFRLARTYEPVNGKDDAVKDAQGKWHFKAGSTVRVRLQMEAPGARYHIVVNDPLPAGTESINPKLKGGESYHQPADTPGTEFDPGFDPWRIGWEDHVNLRDQQTEVFSAKLPAGQYEYTYLIRATTPGDFVVPSAKVEEMYNSETYGTTAPDRVLVE